jgi:hypothetical protein
MAPISSANSNGVIPSGDDPSADYTPAKWHVMASALFNGSKVPLIFPIHNSPDDIGGSSLSFLLRIFRENAMKIYHHILTKKRVLFVGYDHAAGDVCQMVLSAVNMVSPPIPNVIRRAFPYANLSDLSFLEVSAV